MGEGARRNLRRLTAAGAARRYYHGDVAEQAAYDVSRGTILQPRTEDQDVDESIGSDANWQTTGGGGGQDSKQEGNRHTSAETGHGKTNRLLSLRPVISTSARQALDASQREANSKDKVEFQSWITDQSANTVANHNNSSMGRSKQSYTPYSRDDVLDSDTLSTMEESLPSAPEDTPLSQDNHSGSTLLYSPLGVETELTNQTMSKEIHILGVGAIGKFIAHGLASLTNPPPITLLMHRPLLMQQWHDEGGAIQLLREGRIYTQSGFNIESAANFRREKPNQRFAGFGPNLEHSAEPPETNIDTLIVTTAPKATLPALMAVRDRLRPSSTICIIGEGMGVVEELNTHVFPDPQRRPTYILGNVARSPYIMPSDRTFSIVQKGQVSVGCSKLPRQIVSPATEFLPSVTRTDFSWSLPASYLVGLLARVPEFHTRTVGHKSFYKDQLLRLVVSSVIGPISVVHDCSNSELLMSYNAKMAMKAVLEEISLIIRSLPELQSLANVDSDFDTTKLQKIVKSSLIKTASSHSRMLQDVNAGRRTDIDYLNGYLLTRAVELGIDCPINEMLVNVVKGKQMIKSRIADGHVPFLNGENAL